MDRGIVLITLLFVLVFFMGCITNEPLCKSPYIEYKVGECCLDLDGNGVCDKDEASTTQAPIITTSTLATITTTPHPTNTVISSQVTANPIFEKLISTHNQISPNNPVVTEKLNKVLGICPDKSKECIALFTYKELAKPPGDGTFLQEKIISDAQNKEQYDESDYQKVILFNSILAKEGIPTKIVYTEDLKNICALVCGLDTKRLYDLSSSGDFEKGITGRWNDSLPMAPYRFYAIGPLQTRNWSVTTVYFNISSSNPITIFKAGSYNDINDLLNDMYYTPPRGECYYENVTHVAGSCNISGNEQFIVFNTQLRTTVVNESETLFRAVLQQDFYLNYFDVENQKCVLFNLYPESYPYYNYFPVSKEEYTLNNELSRKVQLFDKYTMIGGVEYVTYPKDGSTLFVPSSLVMSEGSDKTTFRTRDNNTAIEFMTQDVENSTTSYRKFTDDYVNSLKRQSTVPPFLDQDTNNLGSLPGHVVIFQIPDGEIWNVWGFQNNKAYILKLTMSPKTLSDEQLKKILDLFFV